MPKERILEGSKYPNNSRIWFENKIAGVQASYQGMDEGFVGVIVSCFDCGKPPENKNRIQVIAFQSVKGVEMPFFVDNEFDMDSPTRIALEASAAGPCCCHQCCRLSRNIAEVTPKNITKNGIYRIKVSKNKLLNFDQKNFTGCQQCFHFQN